MRVDGLGRRPPAPERDLRARACSSSFFTPLPAKIRMRSPEEFFPGTDDRVPPYLTAWEVCRVLRLDIAHGGNKKKALRALRRIVETPGRLQPIRLGKFSRYRRDDVLRLATDPPPGN